MNIKKIINFHKKETMTTLDLPKTYEWYETRKGLLNRFCDLDTTDWGENELFHFLEKPWQSQYEKKQ